MKEHNDHVHEDEEYKHDLTKHHSHIQELMVQDVD